MSETAGMELDVGAAETQAQPAITTVADSASTDLKEKGKGKAKATLKSKVC
jgi:hypothetical protein